jgi:hypothetical protein
MPVYNSSGYANIIFSYDGINAKIYSLLQEPSIKIDSNQIIGGYLLSFPGPIFIKLLRVD